MTTHDVPHLVDHLLERHELHQHGWRFAWDHARRRAGCCKHGRRQVTLSKHYVELNVAERPDEVIDTILHEIAHALVGHSHGHDEVWRAKCVEVGAKPERCYDSEQVAMPQGRYRATCGGCGKSWRRHKQLRAGAWRYCAACGPVWGRLVYADTQAAPADPCVIADAPPPPKKLR